MSWIASAIQERSAAEQRDQFSPLTAAEASDRLGVGDPATGEQTIGARGTEPRYDQQQFTHLCRLRADRRLGDHLRKLDPAGGEFPLQPRTRNTHLVCLRERAQPLLGRASSGYGRAAHNRHRADSRSSRAQTKARGNPRDSLDGRFGSGCAMFVPALR